MRSNHESKARQLFFKTTQNCCSMLAGFKTHDVVDGLEGTGRRDGETTRHRILERELNEADR